MLVGWFVGSNSCLLVQALVIPSEIDKSTPPEKLREMMTALDEVGTCRPAVRESKRLHTHVLLRLNKMR